MSLSKTVGLAVIRQCLFATIMYMSNISYADNSVYRDPATNLMWMRCSVGQTWAGSSCIGEATRLSLKSALDYPKAFNRDGFAGKNDWRLPTIVELATLRRCSNGWGHGQIMIGNLPSDTGVKMVSIPHDGRMIRTQTLCASGRERPTLDVNIFPNTMESSYWTSSPASAIDYWWIVDFYTGLVCRDYTHSYQYARLVRSVQ